MTPSDLFTRPFPTAYSSCLCPESPPEGPTRGPRAINPCRKEVADAWVEHFQCAASLASFEQALGTVEVQSTDSCIGGSAGCLGK